MKDDKKKVMILGVLFVVIIGVGAFTMLQFSQASAY